MAASDGQVVCAAARWAPGGRPLGEVLESKEGGVLQLPGVLKIVRGSCGGLGVPSLPHPTLQPTVLLVSAGRRRQIIAQAVKLRAGRGPVAVGPRLSIPETYPGWFELLSEEGRAGRCVESVAELSRRPCPCLVREPLRAILGRPSPEPGPHPGHHAVIPEGSRTLAVGETISPGEEVLLPGGANHPRGRYLSCATGRGDTVLLSLEQRGRFSPLAKEHNISGAHSARTLLAKRLPLTVRLLHGAPPRGLKSASHFAPELRLLAAYEEEQVFAYPLQKESAGLVALPLSAPLKVLRARNEDALHAMPEFVRLADKCTRLVAEVSDRIHVLDAKLADSKTWRAVPFLRRSASSDSANMVARHQSSSNQGSQGQDENRAPLTTAASSPRLSSSATPDEYDEIDQIYDYVRGFAPLPKSMSVASPAARSTTPSTPPIPHSASNSPPNTPTAVPPSAPPSPTKPEPPPIETIPSKKVGSKAQLVPGQPKAEKRSRHKEDKARLYVKHGAPHAYRASRIHQQSTAAVSPPLGSSVRYKSLSNIHGAMDLDPAHSGAAAGTGVGTLDSSHSGGRTSGDSGPGNKLPEKRSRKLSRPRSLTNLVWEVRGTAPPTKLEPGVHLPAHHVHSVHPVHPVPPAHRSKLSISGHKRLGTLYL